MSRNIRWLLPLLCLAIAGAAITFYPRGIDPEQLSRAKFNRLSTENLITEATIAPLPYEGIYSIQGSYKRATDAEKSAFTITTHLTDEQIDTLLAKHSIKIALSKIGTQSRVWEVVPALLIAVLVICLLAYQLNVGRGKSGQRIRERPQVRFQDVAGIEEAKADVFEVTDFLRDPTKYSRLGGRLPKGILLIGPPGTGKTMLAKAIACEAQAHFFSASGSDFNEVFVGVGAKRVRQLFKQARKHRPAIVFIDEIDCLGKNRKYDQNSELQQTNNALLTAMDGFESSEGIIVIGATNRPEDLDEALLRPGRFDRKIYVPLPDCKGRRAILESHTKHTPLTASETALDVIAQTTPGMSGADLAHLVNEAAILSANRNIPEITLRELEEARDKVRFGQERKSTVISPEERRIVAYHEAGHAITYLQKTLLPPLHKVSIIPRGQSLGSTMVLPKQDQNIHSKRFLVEQLSVLMGGRAAEEVFFGDMTNGANGDLDSAKTIARKMIHDWGMGNRLYYELEKEDAENEINQILESAYADAVQIIRSQKADTEKLAEALLVHDTLDREDVLELLEPQAELAAAC